MADESRIIEARNSIRAAVEQLRQLNYRADEGAPEVYACTFCGRSNTEVERIVTSVGVIICNLCVDEFSKLMSEDASSNESAV